MTFAAREQQALTIDFEPTGSSYTASIHDCGGRARYRARPPQSWMDAVYDDPVGSKSMVRACCSRAANVTPDNTW
ncbi:hypothetical protein C6A85_08565, partial [Mycobacterium sp. ITM-2017-0098]